ncbi:MAG: hypothetical protein AAF687_06165 [Pseudomonadota bacterium]
MKLSVWQLLRVLIGLAVPIPFLFSTWLGLAINNTYFPDTFDAQTYLLRSLVFNVPCLIVAGFIMFWKFKSRRAGKLACAAGIVSLLLISSDYQWDVLYH